MQLAFYRGPRQGIWKAVSWVVRNWTRGPYCHVEVIFSDGLSASASLADGGVRITHQYFHPGHWDIYAVDFDETVARRWFQEHAGLKFDALGVLAFLWRPFRGQPGRWFCSETVAAALGFGEPWRFCPNTLHAAIQVRRC